jgi:hypothetical protein
VLPKKLFVVKIPQNAALFKQMARSFLSDTEKIKLETQTEISNQSIFFAWALKLA